MVGLNSLIARYLLFSIHDTLRLLLQVHMKTEAVMLLAAVALAAIPEEPSTLAKLVLTFSRPGAFNKVHDDYLNTQAPCCNLTENVGRFRQCHL